MNGEADNSRFVSMHVYMHLMFKELKEYTFNSESHIKCTCTNTKCACVPVCSCLCAFVCVCVYLRDCVCVLVCL